MRGRGDLIMILTGDYSSVYRAYRRDTWSTLAIASAVLTLTIIARILI